METESIKIILDKLEGIEQELHFIKKHMVDVDTILTPEEEERLNLSLEEYKEGKTISLERLKPKVGV